MYRHFLSIINQNIKFAWFTLALFLMGGCALIEQEQQRSEDKAQADTQLQLTQYQQSSFKQVEVTFFTTQSKELVFRVLSDIENTSKWFERIKELEVLEVYSNQEYLLRTLIAAPWPFKDRELITCVETQFEPLVTRIIIKSCSERVELDDNFLRLVNMQSSWEISKINAGLVKVNYKTWLDPGGHVPAFIYNRELVTNTGGDMERLQTIINNASMQQYSY